MRCLLDTCVVLDYILKRDDFFNDAEKIFELINNKKIKPIITVKSLMDIHYIIKNITNNEEKTRDIIKDILIVCQLFDSKSSDALKAVISNINDLEDALMIEAALSCEADCIITRNIKDYKKAKINIKTPKEIIDDFK